MKRFRSWQKSLFAIGIVGVIGGAIFFIGAVSGSTNLATTILPPRLSAGPDSGLVGHWTMDGKDTLTGQINDVSGNGYHGSQVNMSSSTAFVRGAIGQAIKTDGVNDYIDLPLAAVTAATSDDIFSIAAWVYVASTGPSQIILSATDGNGQGDNNTAFEFNIDANSANFAVTVAANNSGSVTSPVVFDTWTHLAAVKRGSNLDFYVNGVFVGNDTTVNDVSVLSPTRFRIGRPQQAERFFDGSVDDFRLYTNALTPEAVKQLYQLGATTKIDTTQIPPRLSAANGSGLLAHWTFDGKDAVHDPGWAITNMSYTGLSKSVAAEGVVMSGLEFSSDGTKMYVADKYVRKVYQYSLSTAWDVSTATYDSVSTTAVSADIVEIRFKPDGTKLYIMTSTTLRTFSLSVAWDLSTATDAGVTCSLSGTGFSFNTDGTLIYQNNTTATSQYRLTTAWTLSSCVNTGVSFTLTPDTSWQSGFMADDGRAYYLVGSTTDIIYSYGLRRPYDLSTIFTTNMSVSISSQETQPTGLYITDDGRRAYIIGDANNTVYQYTLAPSPMNAFQSKASVASDALIGGLQAASTTGTKRAQAISGPIGQALYMTNSSSVNPSVWMGDVDQGSAVKTIAFWMKFATSTASQFIINVDSAGGDSIQTDSSSNITATGFPAATVFVDGSSASANIPDNSWHFVAVTDSTGVNANDFAIGSTTRGYSGGIDDVRVFDRVLSLDEIKQLYQLGATTKIATTPIPPRLTGPSLNSGLVAHYTFDGKDVATGQINDVSGNGNHGSTQNTSTSTLWGRGVLGQAINLDGTDDLIKIADSSSLDLGPSNWSASFWAKIATSSASTNHLNVFSKRLSSSDKEYEIYLRTNQCDVNIEPELSGSGEYAGTYCVLATSTWNHVVAELDQSTHTPIFYVNGVLVPVETDNIVNTPSASTAVLYISARAGTQDYFAGMLDDLRLYNRLLSENEVKQLYQMGK